MRHSNKGRIHQKRPNQIHTPKFFSFSEELEKDKEINIQYIQSSDNVVDLFTKALPNTTFRKLIRNIMNGEQPWRSVMKSKIAAIINPNSMLLFRSNVSNDISKQIVTA